jgi:diguanylate cyclase (GGDEF)-like protein/PAS domain S-box-containing protein
VWHFTSGILNKTPLKTILLIENDSVAAETDAATLKDFGYALLVAVTGEKAIELALSDQTIDLVLIDIDLEPPYDCPQTAREISRRRDVPILIYTAHQSQEMVARARSAPQCYGFVAKSSGKFALQLSIEIALELFEERRMLQNTEKGGLDLSERNAAEQALRESEERFHQILSALNEVIWLRDVNTRQVLYVNPAFERLSGLSRDDFYKDPDAFINIIHPDDKKWITKGSLYRSDIHRIVRPDGSIRWVWGRTFPVINEKGEVYRTVAINEDITERKLTEEELKQANEKLIAQMQEIQALQSKLRDQVIRDPMTGLYNRRYLSETLDRELDRALREGYPVSLVMIDIDGFKEVNDTYGHFAGDLVLKQLALQLTQQTRASDLVCRLGGDEFLLVFPNLGAQTAYKRADQCRKTFEETATPFDLVEIRATFSAGIAVFPDHGGASQDVLTAADRAMYAAKEKGRNRVIACE